jgi:hypothetical protein
MTATMTMRSMKTFALLAAIAASSISCGSVIRDGKSPVYLVIDQLLTSRGAPTAGAFTGTLISDVITNVTSGGVCTTASPCPTVFNDFGRVTLRMSPKNIGGGSAPPAPSLNNEVTITRYRVTYRRADGRNTPGVDVPYGFDGAATGTVASGGALTIDFELVRHIAKLEPPLVYLASNLNVIGAITEVTFYGRDQVGNELTVTGQILIEFANHGDPA